MTIENSNLIPLEPPFLNFVMPDYSTMTEAECNEALKKCFLKTMGDHDEYYIDKYSEIYEEINIIIKRKKEIKQDQIFKSF